VRQDIELGELLGEAVHAPEPARQAAGSTIISTSCHNATIAWRSEQPGGGALA
jgi:hypothetical protein